MKVSAGIRGGVFVNVSAVFAHVLHLMTFVLLFKQSKTQHCEVVFEKHCPSMLGVGGYLKYGT